MVSYCKWTSFHSSLNRAIVSHPPFPRCTCHLELCVNLFPWNMSWSIRYFVLFFSLSSHTQKPKGWDKMSFKIMNVTCLCFLFRTCWKATEFTHHACDQFLCLGRMEVSFGRFAPSLGDWLQVLSLFVSCSSHAFDLGSTYIDFTCWDRYQGYCHQIGKS